ncbi:MAG: hypothetical protein ACI3W8_07350 [Oscillospiraceae bacterium]
MKFYSLTNDVCDGALLEPDYQNAREIGKLRLGEAGLYIRSGLKTYHVPYSRIRRCFRRVVMVPAKLCCGRGDVSVENLVLCDESKELATITLPGTRAAKAVMEELRERIPDAEFSCPAKDTAEEKEAT